ncbi:MAG: hypothetical protein AB8G99_08185 [Planctomycetaceae bacterium]
MKISISILGLSIICAMSGCKSIQGGFDEKCNSIHTELTAMEAWARWSWCYEDLTHPKDFAAGFRAGYHDVLNGGAGCQPTLPPRSYWKACYRNAEGHCKVNAWFEGFSHGALAAEKDGASTYGHIPLSPTAHGNLAKAMEEPPVYDWSAATDSVPAPAPAPFSEYQSAPQMDAEIAPATPPANPLPSNDAPAIKSYEEETRPLLDSAVETTSGKVTLPNLGG